MIQLRAELIIMTDVKVMLMPTAVSILRDTPKNMQRPRNRVKTKLLISEAETISSKSFENSIVIDDTPSRQDMVFERIFLLIVV
jgi:hypothetical protein